MILFLIPIFSDISLAMIYNRQFRTNANTTEIFIRTIETLRDKEKITELRSLKEKKELKEAKNENEANEHIITINQTLLNEQYDLYKDAYSAALIFETEDLDTFLKEL